MTNTVDLKVGFRCNNLCKFCIQGERKREVTPEVPLARLRRSLREGLAAGARRLVVTGGEPTLHARVFDIVEEARGLGYGDVLIQSNGRSFQSERVCRGLIAAGVTVFSVSLHGSDARTHDRLISRKGGFVQVVKGIKNLVGLGQRVVTNTVITTANYRDLPAIARLLVSLRVAQCQFAFLHIDGLAEKNKDWLVPRKSVVEPWVKKALDAGLEGGLRVMTEGLPYCFMRGYEKYVAETIIPPTIMFAAREVVPDYTAMRRNEQKRKGPPCSGCVRFDACEGPWREYPDLFGWSEFKPVC